MQHGKGYALLEAKPRRWRGAAAVAWWCSVSFRCSLRRSAPSRDSLLLFFPLLSPSLLRFPAPSPPAPRSWAALPPGSSPLGSYALPTATLLRPGTCRVPSPSSPIPYYCQTGCRSLPQTHPSRPQKARSHPSIRPSLILSAGRHLFCSMNTSGLLSFFIGHTKRLMGS